MIPAQLLVVVACSVFPLAVEIDCRPLAARVGTAYKIDQIVAESVAGRKVENSGSVGAAADFDDAVELIYLTFNWTRRVGVRQEGGIVIVTDIEGSPIRKVTFKFADKGPQPTVRMVPKQR